VLKVKNCKYLSDVRGRSDLSEESPLGREYIACKAPTSGEGPHFYKTKLAQFLAERDVMTQHCTSAGRHPPLPIAVAELPHGVCTVLAHFQQSRYMSVTLMDGSSIDGLYSRFGFRVAEEVVQRWERGAEVISTDSDGEEVIRL
jgi:hypothetical protein